MLWDLWEGASCLDVSSSLRLPDSPKATQKLRILSTMPASELQALKVVQGTQNRDKSIWINKSPKSGFYLELVIYLDKR